MADVPSFTKLVPGFDFLQGLVKNAGSALPTIGQWVAPTLNPEELEKRIEELRTVQFWLEQNARMLGATIQALEVQRMTLSTLRNMNVHMDDLTESLKIRMPTAPAPAAQPPAAQPPAGRGAAAPKPEEEDEEAEEGAGAPAGNGADKAAKPRGARAASKDGGGGPGPVDPMQWWGALTKQFTELAASALKDTASAMKDTAPDAGKAAATGAIKRGAEAGGAAAKKAGSRAPRKSTAGAARKSGEGAARKTGGKPRE